MFYILPALVLGCNNPISLNPLKDYIQEQTGFEPDFEMSGFSDGVVLGFGSGYGVLDGDGDSFGYGCGKGYGAGCGKGYGAGCGKGYGNGYGNYGNFR